MTLSGVSEGERKVLTKCLQEREQDAVIFPGGKLFTYQLLCSSITIENVTIVKIATSLMRMGEMWIETFYKIIPFRKWILDLIITLVAEPFLRVFLTLILTSSPLQPICDKRSTIKFTDECDMKHRLMLDFFSYKRAGNKFFSTKIFRNRSSIVFN